MPPISPTPTEDQQVEPVRPEDPGARVQQLSSGWQRRDTGDPRSGPARLLCPAYLDQEHGRLHPLKIRTGRYGDLEEHELVSLLDTLEDERARARFRESVYISVFVWMAVALVVLFGPKYLWHAPRVVLPQDVLRDRELTTLNAPVLNAPRLRPSPPPSVDNRTLEHLPLHRAQGSAAARTVAPGHSAVPSGAHAPHGSNPPVALGPNAQSRARDGPAESSSDPLTPACAPAPHAAPCRRGCAEAAAIIPSKLQHCAAIGVRFDPAGDPCRDSWRWRQWRRRQFQPGRNQPRHGWSGDPLQYAGGEL